MAEDHNSSATPQAQLRAQSRSRSTGGDSSGSGSGVPVDATGRAAIDPTANVLLLVERLVERLDDLRAAADLRQDDLRKAEARRLDEVMQLRADHGRDLANAEAKRIDAIRAVDVNAVAVASERATQQASVLATQVAASADALRTLVQTTALTIASASEKSTAALTERIALIERSQYEGKGRQGATDPQMELLVAEVRRLSAAAQSGVGERRGSTALWGYILGGAGLVGVLVSIVSFISTKLVGN